jgi:hypothetical protein
MPLILTWHEVAVRVGLAVIAGRLVGLDLSMADPRLADDSTGLLGGGCRYDSSESLAGNRRSLIAQVVGRATRQTVTGS